MSDFKGTPGPWELILGRYGDSPIWGFGIKADGRIPFVAASGMVSTSNHATIIADEFLPHITTGFSAAEAEANARLIAASPELLEALRAARAELSNYTSTCVGGKNSSAIDCIADIDAAIAKALGEQ